MAELSVSGLSKQFGETVVLDDVSVEVPDGSFAVLVGPSGCGKSTLLRLIAGLETADKGTIVMGERDVTRLEPRDRDVAMVFQSYALYPHLSVRENLAFGLKLRKTPPAEIDKRVGEAGEMLGIAHLLERKPSELSGGQRQRVAMGRAIVRRPAVFLFDEPLSNLDAALRAQVRVDIRRLHDKLATTSVYVTHDQVEAMTLADVMFVLNGGHVEQFGPPMEVYDRPASRFVASFLGSPAMNFLEAKATAEAIVVGDHEIPIDREQFAVQKGKVTLGIRPHDLTPAKGGALMVDVRMTEELGGETYAYGSIEGQQVVVRLEPTERVRPGDSLGVALDRFHLFDAHSGRSLRC